MIQLCPAPASGSIAALSLGRTSAAYHRARGPALRLVDRLLAECRDADAQVLIRLLESHEGQRRTLTDYHNRLQRALKRQAPQ